MMILLLLIFLFVVLPLGGLGCILFGGGHLVELLKDGWVGCLLLAAFVAGWLCDTSKAHKWGSSKVKVQSSKPEPAPDSSRCEVQPPDGFKEWMARRMRQRERLAESTERLRAQRDYKRGILGDL